MDDDTCIDCCAPVQVVWQHPNPRPGQRGRLEACQHHSNEYAPILFEQGWIQVQRRTLPTLTADPATH